MPITHHPIVLASASPFRAQILRDAGIVFEISVSDLDESLQPKEKPEQFVRALAARKAMSVVTGLKRGTLVIGADTICAIDGEIIGKPRDAEHARRMIRRSCEAGLQRVITGVCVIDSADMTTVTFSEISLVTMKSATDEAIDAYVESGEPMGKCGALCIESGANFVESFEGSYANIMGLPIERLLPLLLKMTA